MDALIFLTLTGVGLNIIAGLALWAHYRHENAYWAKVHAHKADAWQEGYMGGLQDGPRGVSDLPNPYQEV